VPDAEPVHRTGAEVLDNDVGLAHEVRKNLAAPRLFQVERDAILAAQPVQRRNRNVAFICAAEGHTALTQIRRVLPARIGCAGVFDLDDACAKPCQQERCEWPGKGVRQIQDREARQRTRLCGWQRPNGHRFMGRSLTITAAGG
jgi:hypothetical protein